MLLKSLCRTGITQHTELFTINSELIRLYEMRKKMNNPEN